MLLFIQLVLFLCSVFLSFLVTFACDDAFASWCFVSENAQWVPYLTYSNTFENSCCHSVLLRSTPGPPTPFNLFSSSKLFLFQTVQTVANTRQMVPEQKSQKETKNYSASLLYFYFYLGRSITMVLQIPGSSWLPSWGLPGAQTPWWRKNHHRAATDPTALRAERQAIGAEAVQGRAGRHHSAAAVRVNKNKGTRGTWEVQSVVNCGDTKNQQSWSFWVGGEASCWSLGRLLRNPKKCIASAFFRNVNRIKEDVRRFFRFNFGVWFSTLRSYLAAQLALAEAITCCVDLDRRAITCGGPDYDAAVARGLKHFETNCSDLFFRLFFLTLTFHPSQR